MSACSRSCWSAVVCADSAHTSACGRVEGSGVGAAFAEGTAERLHVAGSQVELFGKESDVRADEAFGEGVLGGRDEHACGLLVDDGLYGWRLAAGMAGPVVAPFVGEGASGLGRGEAAVDGDGADVGEVAARDGHGQGDDGQPVSLDALK